MVCVNAMMMDTIEYGEWKTGQRNEAMITSTRCFVTKCVMAVAGIAVAAVIGLTGYIPQETVQPVNVLKFFPLCIYASQCWNYNPCSCPHAVL